MPTPSFRGDRPPGSASPCAAPPAPLVAPADCNVSASRRCYGRRGSPDRVVGGNGPPPPPPPRPGPVIGGPGKPGGRVKLGNGGLVVDGGGGGSTVKLSWSGGRCQSSGWVPSSTFFVSSRRRHTRCYRDWSSDVCSSD